MGLADAEVTIAAIINWLFHTTEMDDETLQYLAILIGYADGDELLADFDDMPV